MARKKSDGPLAPLQPEYGDPIIIEDGGGVVVTAPQTVIRRAKREIELGRGTHDDNEQYLGAMFGYDDTAGVKHLAVISGLNFDIITGGPATFFEVRTMGQGKLRLKVRRGRPAMAGSKNRWTIAGFGLVLVRVSPNQEFKFPTGSTDRFVALWTGKPF